MSDTTQETKPNRSKLRPLLYLLIPLGFIAYVGVTLLVGRDSDLVERDGELELVIQE